MKKLKIILFSWNAFVPNVGFFFQLEKQQPTNHSFLGSFLCWKATFSKKSQQKNKTKVNEINTAAQAVVILRAIESSVSTIFIN